MSDTSLTADDVEEPRVVVMFQYVGRGTRPIGLQLIDESVVELKRQTVRLMIDASDVRLFLARKLPRDATSFRDGRWLSTILDPDVEYLSRIDYFQEILDKYAVPMLEMRNDARVSEYLSAETMGPPQDDDMHAIILFSREHMCARCPITRRADSWDVALERQRAAEREKAKKAKSTTQQSLGASRARVCV